MMRPAQLHPHDVGLPAAVIRKRRHARRVARWMLLLAGLTALAGWPLYSTSLLAAFRHPENEPLYRVVIAYALLMVSSVTLILGLWYLLVAQISRLARMVDSAEADAAIAADPNRLAVRKGCPTCGWPCDPTDRFCRHCGKPLGASIMAGPKVS